MSGTVLTNRQKTLLKGRTEKYFNDLPYQIKTEFALIDAVIRKVDSILWKQFQTRYNNKIEKGNVKC